LAFYGYRAATAAAFGPLSGFGYVGQGIVGDVGFDSQYADSFWRRSSYLGAPYAAPVSSVLTAASEQWTKLQELVSMSAPSAVRAQERLARLRVDLTYYVQTIEAWVKQGYDFARERGDYWVQNNVVRVFNGINAAVKNFAYESWPDAYEEIAAAQDAAVAKAKADAAAAKSAADAKRAADAKAVADAADAQAKLLQTQDAIADAKSAIADAQRAKAVAAASAQKNRELQTISAQKSAMTAKRVPLILGGLAVLTAGAIYLSRRKKK